MFSDVIPGTCIGCVSKDKKKVPWWDYLLCSSCSLAWNSLIVFSVDLSLFFGMAKLHKPAVPAGNWWLCKRKKKSHDCKNLESSAARITKFLIGTFVQVSALTFSVLICSPPVVPCVFISTPALRLPAHFPCRRLWCRNELLCIDSGWITCF